MSWIYYRSTISLLEFPSRAFWGWLWAFYKLKFVQFFSSLQTALDKDRAAKGKKVKKGGKKARRTGKKGKKKKEKDLTPDRTTESLFEELVVNGILVKYPEFNMKSYLGDRAYSARAPTNPAPGDIRQVIKEYCILPLGSQIIRNFAPCIKSILIAGRRAMKAYLLKIIRF